MKITLDDIRKYGDDKTGADWAANDMWGKSVQAAEPFVLILPEGCDPTMLGTSRWHQLADVIIVGDYVYKERVPGQAAEPLAEALQALAAKSKKKKS